MSADGPELLQNKAEARRARAEQQLADAAKVRAEVAAAKVAEEAKTVRLRALRLAKEAADREAAAAVPAKPAGKRRRREVGPSHFAPPDAAG